MPSCYLCGSTEKLTHDHIPPKNLFPKPLPGNLITVDCCEECHKKLALDDEAFRVFVSSIINRSPAGQEVWQSKVVKSSFKRSKKLKNNFFASLRPLGRHPTTNEELFGTFYPIDRAERYLIRLTKGLMRHFYPTMDYSKSVFEVIMNVPNQNIADELQVKLAYDERGEKTFRFWRGLYERNSPRGVWVFVFYDASMFTVFVT